jgi:hypothetical protein
MRKFSCLLALLLAFSGIVESQSSTPRPGPKCTSVTAETASGTGNLESGTPVTGSSSEGAQFVSSSGNDSNDGLGWGTAKATLTGALAALGSCSTHDVKGRPFVMRCGIVNVGAGRFAIPDGGITIDSPGVSIRGQGAAVTRFTYSGTGAAIREKQYPGTRAAGAVPGGMLTGFVIDGSGDTNANVDGLLYQDLSEIQLNDVMIANFAASGDSCLHGDSGTHWEERVDMWQVWLGNCTVGWKLTNSSSSNTTLGYGIYDLYINVDSGQTGVLSVGKGASATLAMTFSLFHVVVNLLNRATCAEFTNYSRWGWNSGMWRCDGGGSSSHAFIVDSTSSFSLSGPAIADAHSSIASGGGWWSTYSGYPGSDFPFQINTQSGDAQFSQPTGNHVYSWPQKSGMFPVGAGHGHGDGFCAKWDDPWTLGEVDLGTCAIETGSSNRLDVLNVAALTANRTTTVPDADTVLPQPATCSPGQFVEALSATTGLLHCTAPALAVSGQLTTSGAVSDSFTIIGVTSSSHCVFAPANTSAAANIATSYISAIRTNTVSLTHKTTPGMIYDFVCAVH